MFRCASQITTNRKREKKKKKIKTNVQGHELGFQKPGKIR